MYLGDSARGLGFADGDLCSLMGGLCVSYVHACMLYIPSIKAALVDSAHGALGRRCEGRYGAVWRLGGFGRSWSGAWILHHHHGLRFFPRVRIEMDFDG